MFVIALVLLKVRFRLVIKSVTFTAEIFYSNILCNDLLRENSFLKLKNIFLEHQSPPQTKNRIFI